MTLKLRRARKGDEDSFVRIKKNLPMPLASQNEPARGGFLLGTNAGTYLFYIENSFVNVLEDNGEIVGFAIILPDKLLRQSDLWQRKNEIIWEKTFAAELLEQPLCYFEQLAVLPAAKYRFYGAMMAFATIQEAFKTHAALFSTLVIKPIFNPASIPFLETVGGERIGIVDEFIPEFGALVSSVYALDRKVFAERIGQHRLTDKIRRQIESIGDL